MSMPPPTAPHSLPEALLLAHAGATWAMVGLIWFVQLVHYPLMAIVGRGAGDGDGAGADAAAAANVAAQWSRYEARHQQRTSLITAPLMLAELGCAVAILLLGWPNAVALAGVLLLGVVWGMTFLVHIPQHARLARGFDSRVHARLVALNWVRTVAWTARGALALQLVGASGV